MNLLDYINSLNEIPFVHHKSELTDEQYQNYYRRLLTSRTVAIRAKKRKLPTDDKWRSDKGTTGRQYDMNLPPKYRQYIASANSRGLKFKIGLDEFHALTNGSIACAYCGEPGTGIDRIDSRKGYLPNNVQSCCGKCNMMKYTHSEQDFIEHITKIYQYSVQSGKF